MDVAWNKPPYKPRPLSKDLKFKLFVTTKEEKSKMIIATREYKIDLSRLDVTALDNNKNMRQEISIFFLGFKPYVMIKIINLINNL